MKRDKNIVGAIVIVGIAGSIRIGSWLISRNIDKGNSS